MHGRFPQNTELQWSYVRFFGHTRIYTWDWEWQLGFDSNTESRLSVPVCLNLVRLCMGHELGGMAVKMIFV